MMDDMDITSLPDWEVYADTLRGETLRLTALAINDFPFVKMMQVEGMSMDEVKGIVRFFARRLALEGMHVPSGGAFNMPGML